MSRTIALMANTLDYPQGGGHAWVYLNWALGFKSLGCRVIWIERLGTAPPVETATDYVRSLFQRLARYRLDDSVCILTARDRSSIPDLDRCVPFEVAADADLLINFQYDLPEEILKRLLRSA